MLDNHVRNSHRELTLRKTRDHLTPRKSRDHLTSDNRVRNSHHETSRNLYDHFPSQNERDRIL